MLGRWTCPQMTDVPREEWPDHFAHEPDALMRALHSSVGLQLHIEQTLLRQYDNQDLNISVRMWSVSVLAREVATDEVVRFRSSSPVQEGDTTDSVTIEFVRALLDSMMQMLEDEQEESNGFD